MSYKRLSWRYVPRGEGDFCCEGCGGHSFFDAEYETFVTLVPHNVVRSWTGNLSCNRCLRLAYLPIQEMNRIYGAP